MSGPRPLVRATWPLPVALAVATLGGLFAALTGDGWRDGFAAAALAAPLAAVAWAMRAARP